jgi:hypothetical protein
MRRGKKYHSLYKVYEARTQAVIALGEIAHKKNATTSLVEAKDSLRECVPLLGDGLIGRRYGQIVALLSILCHLLNWAQGVRKAEAGADRFLRAAQQGVKDLLREMDSTEMEVFKEVTTNMLMLNTDIFEVENIAELLLHIPLPLPLFAELPKQPPPLKSANIVNETNISVAVVSFTLKGNVFGDPQTIEPNVLHDLAIEVKVSNWPMTSKELILDVISVEPEDVYQMPCFTFSRPDANPPFLLSGTGRMKLNMPQSISSRPLEFTYRARFEPEACGTKVTVVGHRRLFIQSYDPALEPQTGDEAADRKIMDIRNQIRGFGGISDKEIGDYLLIMTALGKIACAALRDNTFTGKWNEKKFQKDILNQLRMDPRIGPDIEEHPHAAGGITDLSYKRIRIELKVESDHYVTMKGAQGYSNQPAQYVAGSSRRLGVLCFLDISRKTDAPVLVANDMKLFVIQPPEGKGEVPLFLGIVIIRGNLAKPSSLSRKRKKSCSR